MGCFRGGLLAVLTISGRGSVVIPAELRRKYHLHPGTEVRIVDYGGVLAIVPALQDPIGQAAGMLKGSESLVQLVVAEHRADVTSGR
jgi:AbrB family looped-hinge helix DNA binding protein